MDAGRLGQAGRGFYSFEHGHLLAMDQLGFESGGSPELGTGALTWRGSLPSAGGHGMDDHALAQLCLLSRTYLMDQFSSSPAITVRSRSIRPRLRSPDGFEGRQAVRRPGRHRQYEDSLMRPAWRRGRPGGVPIPGQIGYRGRGGEVENGPLQRAPKECDPGPAEGADSDGLNPMLSGCVTTEGG